MKWRTSAQSPRTSAPVTALIAQKDEGGALFLLGIYLWKEGRWRSEETFKSPEGEFWWVYEAELLKNLRAAMAGL
jgi:hypothetical protein